MANTKTTFDDLIKLMATLRSPGGCPWDKEQTHESLLRFLREETDEVFEAVKRRDADNLEEELGDILLQVLFHARIAEENGLFSIHDVIQTLHEKLVNRHPHVFENNEGEKLTPEDVKARWNELKAQDKKKRQKNRRRKLII